MQLTNNSFNVYIKKLRSCGASFLFYGFQAQEKDDEIKGSGNSINYTFRMHDPRLGRFFAVDPLEKDFPWNSPYAFGENRLIDSKELEGLESVDAKFNLNLGFSVTLGKVDNALKIFSSFTTQVISQVGSFEFGAKYEVSLYTKQKGFNETSIGSSFSAFSGIGVGKPVNGGSINFTGSGVTFPGSGINNDGAPITLGYGLTFFSGTLQGSSMSQAVGTIYARFDASGSTTSISTSNDMLGDGGDRIETAGVNFTRTEYFGNSEKFQAGINLRLLTDSPIMEGGKRSIDPTKGPNGTYNTFGPRINSSSSLTLTGAYSNSSFNIRGNIGVYGSQVAHVFQNLLIHNLGGYPHFNNPDQSGVGGSVEVGTSTGP